MVTVEFLESFALKDEVVGLTPLVKHEIDTGETRPIKCRGRSLPLARQEACVEAVLNLLQAASTCQTGGWRLAGLPHFTGAGAGEM